jgi:hypothetical protein
MPVISAGRCLPRPRPLPNAPDTRQADGRNPDNVLPPDAGGRFLSRETQVEITMTLSAQNPANAQAIVCSGCDGELVATQVDTQLFVRLRGDDSGSRWTTTQLDAWTCLGCGRTDLYAAEPGRLAS